MSSRNSSSSMPSPPATPTVTACTPPTVPTKLCHIVKQPDFEGYGFNLHSEKVKPGQYVGKVDANSPAELAGLKEGDRIIEVNGVAIGNETHKQVVQRIKALACEVRLLLIDVDGGTKSTAAPHVAASANGNSSNNVLGLLPLSDTAGPTEGTSGTKHEIPGASANISSISMVSTKRTSTASNQSSKSEINVLSAANVDVTDKAVNSQITTTTGATDLQTAEDSLMTEEAAEKSRNGNMPLPPSAIMAAVSNKNNNNNTTMATLYNSSNSNGQAATITPNLSSSNNNSNKTGGLQLPMTAAEMRAKLFSKKKYDPKNESVDLKKKFEIIQKL